ncbi:hypothetical protein G6F57_011847 [Rhizopus arrhizus]|uniref:Uncharacterized protein n=1 Tax=Rhizopus oryzae TaxID=64495 RepID=A0A9P6X2H1_RHIOR|nr:hypothetical protein G6F24_009666 [Rhizopus arrhizus]KAG0781955.1 hypothetical protein G6F21_011374 [Rhizopus arrhizus]KAG0805528.1 hypothetical protein G6F20_011827 [Rhizopus arrhizus]KAG0822255.1 hypothetical protein G6F18_011846 [Rhizopus arrhizus]KAG0824545.1 hypothetical protein G6F19_010270 [Rhizopus arrhizus]
MSKKLTKGQASCLVLDMVPTKENRKLAKWKIESIGLTPTYTNETSAMEPLAIAATLQQKNPFRYMAYDDTPPSSPCESSVKRFDITKEYILDVMRVLVLKDPEDNEKYERIFLTNKGIWNLLKDEINEFGDACTSKQLAKWIANDGNWGQLKRQQEESTRSRATVIDNVKNVNSYRAFAHVDAEKWMIVGYARKSITKEDDSVRHRLLTSMIIKLKKKLLCCKVFVSPFSNSDIEFEKRDRNAQTSKFIESLKCDGTMEDLLLYLASETRMIRLVAIDYAGLTTNLEDLRSFVSKYKCIKEIIIDKGHRVEVISRKRLLKDDKILQLFRCRVKAVNRSN